jgi:hypothetical protein
MLNQNKAAHQHNIIPQTGKNNQDDARMNIDYKKSVEYQKEHQEDAKKSVNDREKKMHKQDKASEKDKVNNKMQHIKNQAASDAVKDNENKHGNTSQFEEGGVEQEIKQRQDKGAGERIREDEINDETTEDLSNRDEDLEIPENKKEEARETFEKFNRNAMNG